MPEGVKTKGQLLYSVVVNLDSLLSDAVFVLKGIMLALKYIYL
jgi:hypothetical protein